MDRELKLIYRYWNAYREKSTDFRLKRIAVHG